MKKIAIIINAFLIFLIGINLNAQPYDPPVSEMGTATIDGSFGEWNLTNDWFSDMYQARDPNKPLMAKLYVRYDCSGHLYILVLAQGDYLIQDDFANENWIKIREITNDALTPINFTYILDNSNTIGWEASYSVAEGNYFLFEVHTLIIGEEDDETSRTNEIQLKITCPLPVEMTSFSVVLSNKLAQLNWETATEVNNYGFEIQRLAEDSDWSKVGFVQGHGNSNSPKYYSFTDAAIHNGDYSYRLKQIDIDGQYEYSDVVEIKLSAPEDFVLNKNYPNPFNPTTMITYSIPRDAIVILSIYDILGNEVAILENGYKSAGSYSNSFDATNLTSGIYFYTIRSGNFYDTKKMLLMK
jgi:Secretion system C-terminal sorting domain